MPPSQTSTTTTRNTTTRSVPGSSAHEAHSEAGEAENEPGTRE